MMGTRRTKSRRSRLSRPPIVRRRRGCLLVVASGNLVKSRACKRPTSAPPPSTVPPPAPHGSRSLTGDVDECAAGCCVVRMSPAGFMIGEHCEIPSAPSHARLNSIPHQPRRDIAAQRSAAVHLPGFRCEDLRIQRFRLRHVLGLRSNRSCQCHGSASPAHLSRRRS